MSIEHELSPGRRERLLEIRMGIGRQQKPAWLIEALVDALDMIDEMVAGRALERDAVDLIRDLVAQRADS